MLALAALSCPGSPAADAGLETGRGAALENAASPAFAAPPPASLHDDDWDAPLS